MLFYNFEAMPKQKVDEQFIITQSLKLFREKSYHTTSMADIAKACGLLKGSLYHYFDSKEDLMKRVISQVHNYFKDEVFSVAYNEELDAVEKMRELTKRAENVFVHRETGAVLGNVGVETALVEPEFAQIIRQFFKDFFEAVKNIYLAKYPDEIASELAERSVAEVEGAISLSRIFDDKIYLTNTLKRIIQRIEK
jgi:TetR/AcrR family transcriptional repressor of nem operon